MAAGSLILVATPIGNLGDLSPRAVEVLATASVIACEDTRHTRTLLNHAGIKGVPVIAVHEHNEAASAVDIVARLERGETVAMVADAGMPAISDPGERVVAAVGAAGLTVSVVPGPSAAPSAVAVAGFSSERWCFEGFLPRKATDRQRRLAALAAEDRTSVLYEAPQRLAALADELVEACGTSRRVVLVRELTKLHEEVWRGTAAELAERAAAGVKGECVVVVEGAPAAKGPTPEAVHAALAERMAAGMSARDATSEVVELFSVPKRSTYELAQKLKPSR